MRLLWNGSVRVIPVKRSRLNHEPNLSVCVTEGDTLPDEVVYGFNSEEILVFFIGKDVSMYLNVLEHQTGQLHGLDELINSREKDFLGQLDVAVVS